MNMKKKIILISSILIVVDLIIKIIVDNYLLGEIIIINNFFYLKKVYNTGAAFSLFSGNTLFLILSSVIIFVYLLEYLKSFKNNKFTVISFSFMFAGLIGNLIDRIFYGHVIDYIKFEIFSYNAPIFNFADMLIFFGVLLLSYLVIIGEDQNEI